MHFKKNTYYVFLFYIFLCKDILLLSSYSEAMDYCNLKDYDSCFNILFDLEKKDVKYNYDIAEIYLNDFNNYNIALHHFEKVINYAKVQEEIDLEFLIRTEGNVEFLNTYKKSLFMYAYICSNYLGMYTDGYIHYKKFLKNFPDDELKDAVEYEMNALKSKEDSKEELMINSN